MGGTLFFVHGTGVRQDGFDDTMKAIRDGMRKAGRSDLDIRGLPWGVQAGSRVSETEIDAFLPPAAAKAAGENDEEIEAEVWRELLADPLFELRLATTRRREGLLPPGEDAPSELLKRKLLAVSLPSPAGGVAADDINRATAWLATGAGARTLADAANAIGDASDPDLIRASARALVAHVLSNARGELGAGPDALYDSDARDALVNQIAEAIEQGKGVGTWLQGLAVDFAKAKATDWAKQRRKGLMTAASPGIGDIIYYQRRGDEISALLKQEIEKIDADIHLVGHSLGGIFLVDLLSSPATRPANVKSLTTVGSQSPFFYAADCLRTLRPGLAGASPFTPWLNVYDRNDFLSFCAARTFPHAQHVTDFEVRSKVPFPDSHGAYFRLAAFYTRLAQFIPQ